MTETSPSYPPLKLFGASASRLASASLAQAAAMSWHPQPEVFGLTDRGRVRTSNQDQFLVAELERSLIVQQVSLERDAEHAPTTTSQGHLFAVADGVGGGARGDVAAAVAVDAVFQYALTSMPWLTTLDAMSRAQICTMLREAMERAQHLVRRISRREQLGSRMATTLTVALVTWPWVTVAHAGDSRCYRARGGQIEQITRDHTLAAAFADAGRSFSPPRRLRPRLEHVLVKAIGGGAPHADVEVHQFELAPDDILLLCTDGLTASIDDDQILDRLASRRPVEVIARELVDAANERGGGDNITVVLARF